MQGKSRGGQKVLYTKIEKWRTSRLHHKSGKYHVDVTKDFDRMVWTEANGIKNKVNLANSIIMCTT